MSKLGGCRHHAPRSKNNEKFVLLKTPLVLAVQCDVSASAPLRSLTLLRNSEDKGSYRFVPYTGQTGQMLKP